MAENKNDQELIDQLAEKKKEREQMRKDEEGRVPGMLMFNIYVALTGINPFTEQPTRVNRQGDHIVTGIGTKEYPNAHLFSTKLKKNAKELAENLQLLSGIFPTLSHDLKKKQDQFKKKLEALLKAHANKEVKTLKAAKTEIIKKHIGFDDLSKFNDQETNSLLGEDGRNKIEELEDAHQSLKENYDDLFKRQQEINDEINEILRKPLLKCDFDMISEKDAQNSGISMAEQLQIDIMLDF